jgi:hypothetical protein
MGKRIMLTVVGAGIGGLVGLAIAFLGAGNAGVIGGAAVGAVVPQFLLGSPGK